MINFLKKLDFKTLLILTLILVILFLRACSGDSKGNKDKIIKVDGKKYILVKHTVDTVYEKVTETVYRDGETVYVDRPIYIPVPGNVDTSEILKDYYAKYTYKDTLKLKDSLGFITVTDTIFKNKLYKRIWVSNVNKITVNEKLYLKDPPKIQFFVGGTLGFDKVNIINFAGPSFVLKDKKDHLYSLSLGYSNAKSIVIQGGMLWKISLKK